MENEKFQELSLAHFKEVSEKLSKMNERLGNIEVLIKQHHGDTEKTAVQVEKMLFNQEALQDDMDYLLRRSLRKKID